MVVGKRGRASSSDDEEAPGHDLLVGREVLASHARFDLDESRGFDVRGDESRDVLVVGHRFVSGLVRDGSGAAMRFGDVLRDALDRLPDLRSHLGLEGSDGPAQLGGFWNDVGSRAAADAGDAEHRSSKRVHFARDDVLEVRDDLSDGRDWVDRLVGKGGVRTLPAQLDANVSAAAMNGPIGTATFAASTSANTWPAMIASTPSSAPAAMSSRAPPGGVSSACWNMKRISPRSSLRLATNVCATARRMAVCMSCPQACMTPGRVDANSTSLSSVIGSASMSARSASACRLRPGSRATTLVALVVRSRGCRTRAAESRRRQTSDLGKRELRMPMQVTARRDDLGMIHGLPSRNGVGSSWFAVGAVLTVGRARRDQIAGVRDMRDH